MSLQTKKRINNISKIIGSLLFALIIFTNIKVALLSDTEIEEGKISILGYEIELFQPSYAEDTSSWWCLDNCWWHPIYLRCRPSGWEAFCLGMCQPIGSNECIFKPGW